MNINAQSWCGCFFNFTKAYVFFQVQLLLRHSIREYSGYLNIGMHGEECPDLKENNKVRPLTKDVL